MMIDPDGENALPHIAYQDERRRQIKVPLRTLSNACLSFPQICCARLHASEVPSEASISEAFRVRNLRLLTASPPLAAPLAAQSAASTSNSRYGPARTAAARYIFHRPSRREARRPSRRFFRATA